MLLLRLVQRCLFILLLLLDGIVLTLEPEFELLSLPDDLFVQFLDARVLVLLFDVFQELGVDVRRDFRVLFLGLHWSLLAVACFLVLLLRFARVGNGCGDLLLGL